MIDTTNGVQLGSDGKDGPRYRLPAPYHQLLTNAFRREWNHGRDKPNEQEAKEIMLKVYSEYPIPQLMGIEHP